MKRTLLATIVCGAFTWEAAGAGNGAARHPMALQAETAFFEALEEAPGQREAALQQLLTAYAVDATDARTSVLLGLGHLWAAADGRDRDPKAIEHLVLAERFLTRAAELDPGDDRIPSWVLPARMALAGIDRQPDRFPGLYAGLMEAYGKRPTFHSFSVALVNAHQKPGTPRFEEGLKALRAAIDGCNGGTRDRSCGNLPHAPRNTEGFTLFTAAYEARAGNQPRAAELIEHLRGLPGYAGWSGRESAEALGAALKGEPGAMAERATATLKSAGSCRSCHGAR